MVRGLYSAASAMLVYELRQDLLAHDLANAQTPGYRPQDAPVEAFPDMLIYEEVHGLRQPRGVAGTGAYLQESFTRWGAQGPVRYTGRSLDVAIEGDGFFVVLTPAGPRLTRAGNFTVSGEGLLVNADGHPVLGSDGPISLAGADPNAVVIGQDGGVFDLDGRQLGQILVVDVPNRNGLVREGATLYRYTALSGGPVPSQARLEQGALEGSGTSVVRTMVEMIAAVRAYQSAQVAVRTHDEMTGELISQVGRLT